MVLIRVLLDLQHCLLMVVLQLGIHMLRCYTGCVGLHLWLQDQNWLVPFLVADPLSVMLHSCVFFHLDFNAAPCAYGQNISNAL